jgi:hypothetical protein
MAVLIADNYSQVECNRKRRRLENEENNKNEPSVVGSINPLCQTNRLNMVVPDFNCPAVLNGAIKRLQLSELFQSNKAVVLFFYPCDL